MRTTLSLTSQKGNSLDARNTIMMGYSLLTALAELMRGMQRLALNTFIPRFLGSSIIIEGESEPTADLFGCIDDMLRGVARASELLKAAEQLLKTELADRMLLPAARLPIPVRNLPALEGLLAYDKNQDHILCGVPDWHHLVSTNLRVLKSLSSIAGAELTPRLEIDGTAYDFPAVSATIFDHGTGAGHTVAATALVTGHFLVAGEIEARIDGFRDNRVGRAVLNDTARESAIGQHPPYSVAIQYWEPTPHLPLLPASAKPKVVVERMWAFESQTELDLTKA
jgi:hypothetical protein